MNFFMFTNPEKISYPSLNKACLYKFKEKTDKIKLPEAALVTGGGGKWNPPPSQKNLVRN